MKFPFLALFLLSVRMLNAQVNGTEINSNSSNNSPSIIELNEIEIPAIQEDIELQPQIIQENKNKDLKKQEKVRLDNTIANDIEMTGSQGPNADIIDLSIKMDELLNDIKFSNSRKSPTYEQALKMENIVNQYENFDNQSFEFNYFNYIAGNYNVDKVDYLKKAEAIKPQNTDVQIQLSAYYFIKDIPDSSALYLQKLVDVNRIDSTALIYAQDLLTSVSQDGYLFTHGFDDSYACAYLQKVENYRNDVTLLPFEFLQSSHFVNRFKNLEILNYENQIVDNEYLKNIVINNKNKKIHISISFPKEYFYLFQENIYTKGLTFVLDNNENELIADNLNFYQTISKELINNAISEKAKRYSLNYLPVLFYLKDYFESNQDKLAIEEIDKMINQIAVQSNKYNQIKKLKR